MQQFSGREKYLVANTLSCLPIVLKGQAVLIDLLNETSVAGRIENADGFMHIHLSNAVFIDRNGQQYIFNEFMVKSRMIRQIHIPGKVDVEAKLRNFTDHGLRPKKPLIKNNAKRTFKQKRAEERHKEILQQISTQKQTTIEKSN